MTDPTPGAVRPVTVRDRKILVRKLIDTQYMLLNRCAQILTRPHVDKGKKLETIDRMFTVLESAIVNDEDREFLEDLMAEGKLDLRELLGFVTVFEGDEEDDSKVEEQPKVRRARTPAKRA